MGLQLAKPKPPPLVPLPSLDTATMGDGHSLLLANLAESPDTSLIRR